MKKLKLLVLSSALIMGLTACGGGAGGSTDTTTSDPTTTTTASSSTQPVTVDYATLANEAITNISARFDRWSSAGIAVNQTLVKESKVTHNGKEYTFAITYTISDAAKSFLEVSADGATLIVKVDTEQHALKEAVVVHASIEGKEYASKGFNVKILATRPVAISEIYDCKKGDSVLTCGYVTKILANGNILVADGESAITVFTKKSWDAAVVGKLVQIAGTLDIYNGLYELKPETITETTSSTVAKPVDLVLDGTFDASNARNQGRIAKVEDAYLSKITAAEKESTSQSSLGEKYNQVEATIMVGSKAEGYVPVSIHVEDRKCSEGVFETWGFDATAANKLGPNAPQVGQGISVEGFIDWYKKGQLSDVKLIAKGEYKGDYNPSETKPAPAAVKKTVGEILKFGEKTVTDQVFEVTGVLEGLEDNNFGNGYLTDPTTKETITIYGLTGTADKGISWDGAAFSFSNPQDAKTSLVGLTNGMEITMKCLYLYFSGTKTPQIQGNLLSKKASTATYTATATSANDPEATITLSKTEGIVYGEEITVNATSSKAGYVVDTIKVTNAQGAASIVQDNKFNATCVNTVEVTFRDGTVAKTNMDVTAVGLGIGSSYGNGTEKIIDGVQWSFDQCMSQNGYIQMNKRDAPKPNSSIWNTTALPKAIKDVVVTYNSKTLEKNRKGLVVTTGTTMVTEKGSATLSPTENALVYTYTSANKADTFVQFAHNGSSGALYIDSIVINFVD